MKEVGYGKDYAYAHDFAHSTTDMETFPEKLKGRKYYEPGDLGLEKDIKKRIDWWNSVKARIRRENSENKGQKKRERRERPANKDKKVNS